MRNGANGEQEFGTSGVELVGAQMKEDHVDEIRVATGGCPFEGFELAPLAGAQQQPHLAIGAHVILQQLHTCGEYIINEFDL